MRQTTNRPLEVIFRTSIPEDLARRRAAAVQKNPPASGHADRKGFSTMNTVADRRMARMKYDVHVSLPHAR